MNAQSFGKKRQLIFLALAVLVGIFSFYRLNNPYTAFNELCRSGSLGDVCRAVENGADLNPPLIQLGKWVDSNTLMEKTTHSDGITTYAPVYTGDNDYAFMRGNQYGDEMLFTKVCRKFVYLFRWLRLRLWAFLFHYADEPPVQSAVRINPDPRIAALLIEKGARDADGMGGYSMKLACQRRIPPEGLKLDQQGRDFWEKEKNVVIGVPDTEGTMVIAAAILAGSLRTTKEAAAYLWVNVFEYSASTPEFIYLLLSDANMKKAAVEQKGVLENAAMFIKDAAGLEVLLQAGADPARFDPPSTEVPGLTLTLHKDGSHETKPTITAMHPYATGTNALNQAAKFNTTPGIVSVLLKYGANCNSIDKNDRTGKTPLAAALLHKNIHAANELLESADRSLAKPQPLDLSVTCEGTALLPYIASNWSEPAIIDKLTAAGLRPEQQVLDAALLSALLNDTPASLSIADKLLALGADINHLSKWWGEQKWNLYIHVLEKYQSVNPSTAEEKLIFLLSRGADPDRRDLEAGFKGSPTALQFILDGYSCNQDYLDRFVSLFACGSADFTLPPLYLGRPSPQDGNNLFAAYLNHRRRHFRSKEDVPKAYPQFEEAVRSFISSKAGTATDNSAFWYDNPLPAACSLRFASPPTIAALLQAGANPKKASLGGWTPLHVLVMSTVDNWPDANRILALYKETSHAETLMFNYGRLEGEAVLERDSRSLKTLGMLLTAGADPMAVAGGDAEAKGLTSFFLTIRLSGIADQVVPLFIAHGAEVNSFAPDGASMLSHVVRLGNSTLECEQERAHRLVALLIDLGAEYNMRDAGEKGFYPILWALQGRDTSLARLLFEKGASLNVMDSGGATPLHHVVVPGFANDIAFLNFLLENGADPNIADNNGVTPLMLAADKWGKRDEVAILLRHGADPNLTDCSGKTALMYNLAGDWADFEYARQLLEAGADVNHRDNEGKTALMLVREHASRGDSWKEKRVRMLIEAGAK